MKIQKKNLTQETCPERGSNPGPLRHRRACYRLLHIGGPEQNKNDTKLRGATGEISNFYNLSARLLIFNTHIPPIIIAHTSKFCSFLFDTF